MSNFNILKYDYGIYYSIASLRAHGKLGKAFIFKQYWYGRRVDPYHYPYNPRTVKQERWREYFAKGWAGWKALSEEQKREYNYIAGKTKLYGVHRFLNLYLRACLPFNR